MVVGALILVGAVPLAHRYLPRHHTFVTKPAPRPGGVARESTSTLRSSSYSIALIRSTS